MDLLSEPKKNVRRHLIESVFIFLLGVPAAILFCDNCWDQASFYYITIPFSGFVWVMLWKGNELIFDGLNTFLPWQRAPLKRLLINVLLTISYTVVAMTGITLLFFYFAGVEPEEISLKMAVNYSGSAVVITIIIATFVSARGFFLSWRDLAVQNERLKKESLSSQYEVLKQQVNPHFLFNSLNTLTNLVYEDPDQSAKFIKELSNVYRYVLESHGKEVLALDEELDFVNSYVFLQQIRYGDLLRVEIDLPRNSDILIPPLCLQMLIENAIKHNEVSAPHPLQIQIGFSDNYLVVANKVRRREKMPEHSVKIGLKNIQSRYSLLSEQPVILNEEEGQFVVKLPALYDKQ